jgi:CheY-like chemotaxis protein
MGCSTASFPNTPCCGMVALLTQDLLFSSRLAAEARSSGIDLYVLSGTAALIELVKAQALAGILLDLETSGLDVAALLRELPRRETVRVIAYGPHVHERRLAAAAEAGCDEVLSRGQLDKSAPTVLRRLAGVG